jgi:hypothetical protein
MEPKSDTNNILEIRFVSIVCSAVPGATNDRSKIQPVYNRYRLVTHDVALKQRFMFIVTGSVPKYDHTIVTSVFDVSLWPSQISWQTVGCLSNLVLVWCKSFTYF